MPLRPHTDCTPTTGRPHTDRERFDPDHKPFTPDRKASLAARPLDMGRCHGVQTLRHGPSCMPRVSPYRLA